MCATLLSGLNLFGRLLSLPLRRVGLHKSRRDSRIAPKTPPNTTDKLVNPCVPGRTAPSPSVCTRGLGKPPRVTLQEPRRDRRIARDAQRRPSHAGRTIESPGSGGGWELIPDCECITAELFDPHPFPSSTHRRTICRRTSGETSMTETITGNGGRGLRKGPLLERLLHPAAASMIRVACEQLLPDGNARLL